VEVSLRTKCRRYQKDLMGCQNQQAKSAEGLQRSKPPKGERVASTNQERETAYGKEHNPSKEKRSVLKWGKRHEKNGKRMCDTKKKEGN